MAVTQDVRNKVVVRKLPPGISQEEVQAAIDVVCQGKYDWFTFVPGKVSLKRIKHSRAYLNFLDASEVLRFKSQFAGHAFVNKKGAQYRCLVEYAPYQRIPREKAKEDPREGTYENDADFIAFKQQIEGDPELLPSAEVQLDLKEQAKKALAEAVSKPKVTPLMQFLHDKHSLKPEKKTIVVPVKKKPGKTGADLDLPPHMLNKQGAPPQAASSKPPLSHQSNSSVSGKATVLPIPMTAQTQASPGGKVKKTHDQFPGKARARATEEESSVSSRASTPSGKGKQHSQDSGGVNGRSEPPLLSSPSSARKVVPIKLDRAPRQSEHQPKISRQPGDAAQHAAASNDPQVWYEQWDPDKTGRKVRPGFQTWTPRRGGRGDEAGGDEAGPPGPPALSAARAAAAAALRAHDKATGKQAQPQAQLGSASLPSMASQGSWEPRGPPQPAKSGWDDDEEAAPQMPAHLTANPGRGRASSLRGRAALGSVPHDNHTLPDTWGTEPNGSHEEQDGWGDPVSVSTSAIQAAPAGRQGDSRARGRGRVRGRGARGGYPDQSMSATDSMSQPPGNFRMSSTRPAVEAAPARTFMIKKRPQAAAEEDP
ncbi:hypothetical protein ABBQ32_005495 [Trebouxia sp. C0010 RCD-2024]